MTDASGASPASSGRPANVIVILLDSLNRHMLGAYGGAEFDTPNLDRLARRSVRFTQHFAGSLPCIPARHDLLCGALDFPWRPWGSIEVWEQPITASLATAGVTSVLISDHPHLFETGGENYHAHFNAWEYERGHESDPWKTRADPSWTGAPFVGRPAAMPYHYSRSWFRGEEDFPGPRTMRAAAAWVRDHAPFHDRFFLFIDEFDPHEPFDTPEPYASMYDPAWEGPHLVWPPYRRGALAKGELTSDEARQIRASYGAKLTMIDTWLGRLLDAIDERGLWDSTAVVLCTDHGHYLGEKDIWGKPQVPVYQTLGHIPLFIAWPGRSPGVCDALTTTVDIFATIADVFGVSVEQRTHGESLVPLLQGHVRSVREHVLCGVWGREVHLIDRAVKYARAPEGDNEPLSMWSNRWSTMPTVGQSIPFPRPDDRAVLDHMPGSSVPVIRQPFRAGDLLPYWAYGRFSGHHLFDLEGDPDEEHNLAGTVREKEMADRLADALRHIDAPSDQLERLGLS